MDECPQDGYERDKVMQCLHEIRVWGIPPLHVLMTSPREHDIASYLYIAGDMEGKGPISGFTAQPSLKSHSSEMGGDIEAYIDAQLRSLRFRHWKPELKQRVRIALVEKAQGMYA